MGEKETETKVEQEIKETGQPEGEVEPQPTVEELQKEIGRKEEVIKQTKRELSRAQSRGVPKVELESLHQKIDGMQDWVAGVMDDLAGRVASGEGYEEPKPQRKTYSQQLKERRDSQPKGEPKIDPRAQKVFDYLENNDLDLEDEIVQEAFSGTKTPEEALGNLKTKLKEKNKVEQEEYKKQIKLEVEQQLKDKGLTSTGAGTPSGSGGSFTRQQISDMSSEEWQEKKEEIIEAQRQGKIK